MLRKNMKFVYGGNAHSAAVGNSRVSELLLQLKEENRESVTLLLGDRDAIKMLMAASMSAILHSSDQNDSQSFWKEIDNLMNKRSFWFRPIIEASAKAISNCDRLAWMINVILGTGGSAFEERKGKLEREGGLNDLKDVGDDEEVYWFVAKSLLLKIDEAKDKQLKYVTECVLAVTVGSHLCMHGSLTAKNAGQVPGKKGESVSRMQCEAWISALNEWLTKIRWDEDSIIENDDGTNAEECSPSDWVKYFEPGGWNGISVVAHEEKVEAGKELHGGGTVDDVVSDWLMSMEVGSKKMTSVISGHLFVSDQCPMVMRSKNTMQIYCNTNLGEHKPGSRAVSEVLLWEDGKALVTGRVLTEEIEYLVNHAATDPNQFLAAENQGEDPYVGHKLPRPGGGEMWVRAKIRARSTDQKR